MWTLFQFSMCEEQYCRKREGDAQGLVDMLAAIWSLSVILMYIIGSHCRLAA